MTLVPAGDVDVDVWGPAASGVTAIERELARLRRGRSALARERTVAVARAAVLNLVVVATREIHALRATRAVALLAQRHPSRAIVVLADRRSEGEPSLGMHALLPRSDGSARVCFEQILIRARGAADGRIESAVIPLLLPDLPVFVWWTETPPLGRRHFEELLALADRLIVDSSDFARPEETLPALARIGATGGGRCAVTDLNWARLTPWRELVTQFFDVPAWRPYLGGIEGIRASFAVDADGRQVHPSQALLLLGWIASRLGWQGADPMAPSEAGGLLFAMGRPDGARVRVRLRPRFQRGLVEGDLSGVRLEATHEGHRATFLVRRSDDGRHTAASVEIDGRRVVERIVPHADPGVVELLEEELTIVASDVTYEQALGLLVTLG